MNDFRRLHPVYLLLLFSAFCQSQAPGPSYGAMPALAPRKSDSIPAFQLNVPSLPQIQSSLQGSIPAGEASSNILSLSLRDAINRGLRQNLALSISTEENQAVRAQRVRTLAELMPNVSAYAGEAVQQINLAAFGFTGNAFPGLAPIVGPFGTFDVRALYSQKVFDWRAIQNTRASGEDVKASRLSYQNTRELVVFVVANLYLQISAGKSRLDAAHAQLASAEAIYQQAVDLRTAGLAAGIDVLRSQVEMQAQQQRVLAATNDLQIQKLNLARAIGLPLAQQFETDEVPYSAAPAATMEAALADAYRDRADYQQALASLRAAQLRTKAAQAQHLPILHFNGDYGVLGPAPGHSHGTFTARALLEIPIFQGGVGQAETLEADAAVQQRKAALADLQARIEMEIRTAFMNLTTAAQQVEVAQSSVALANEQLGQARDRLSAGVANTLEVVQAEQAVAAANESYINSVYAHSVAKANLARATGIAEQAIPQYLGGK